MKLVFASDHVGIGLKQKLMEIAAGLGHEVTDCGTFSEERTDYPVWGSAAARKVACGEADRGVLVCGTGVGIGIAANKINGIRCVTCSEPFSAKLSREHNDSNMLSMGSRVVGAGTAEMILKAWLDAEYEGGRHQRRIDQIAELEENQTLER